MGTTPKPDESLASFIIRSAARRRSNLQRFTMMNLGPDIFQGIGEPNAIARFATMTNTSVEELEAISYGPNDSTRRRFKGIPVTAAYFWLWREQRRVCPECLRESLHHRAVWDLSFSTWCLKHRRRLVSSCPACGRKLAWDCNDLNGCPCGSCDLMSVPTDDEEPDPDELQTIAVALGLLGEERHHEDAARVHALMPLRELEPADALEFVCRVGSDLLHPDYNYFGITRFGRGWAAKTSSSRASRPSGPGQIYLWIRGLVPFTATDRQPSRRTCTRANSGNETWSDGWRTSSGKRPLNQGVRGGPPCLLAFDEGRLNTSTDHCDLSFDTPSTTCVYIHTLVDCVLSKLLAVSNVSNPWIVDGIRFPPHKSNGDLPQKSLPWRLSDQR